MLLGRFRPLLRARLAAVSTFPCSNKFLGWWFLHASDVVQFYARFNFYLPLFLWTEVNDNEFKTKENKNWTTTLVLILGRKTKISINSMMQHIKSVRWMQNLVKWRITSKARCGSIPVSTSIRKSVRFLIINIFLVKDV